MLEIDAAGNDDGEVVAFGGSDMVGMLASIAMTLGWHLRGSVWWSDVRKG